MGQLTFVQLLVMCTLIVMVASTQDKTNHGLSDRSRNPDILKEFRTFADTVIPQVKEPHTRNLKNLTAAVKDPAHPFALYIDGPSVSQLPHNVTVSSRNTVAKDTAPIATNLISKAVNETSSVQRNVTAAAIPPGGVKRELENSTSIADDDSSGDDGDDDENQSNEETSKLTKDSKDGGNVIAEALATAKKDASESFETFANSNAHNAASMPPAAPPSTTATALPPAANNAPAPAASNPTSYAQQTPSRTTAEALLTSKPDTSAPIARNLSNNMQQTPMVVPADSAATKDAPEPFTGIQASSQLHASNPPEAVDDGEEKKKSKKKVSFKNTTVIAKPPDVATVNVTTVNEKSPKERPDTLTNTIDDEVDTYIDEAEEKPRKNVKTTATKKKHPKRKSRHGKTSHRLSHKGHTHHKAIKVERAKVKVKTHIKPNVYIYKEHHQPTPVEHHIGKSRSGALPPPQAAPPAPPQPPPPPPPPVCMTGCSEACAPACTPQCCALETAPPPIKEPAAPKKEKNIRWMERPHYEPGPNYPPPPIPPLVIKKVINPNAKCAPTCARSTCAPACLPSCCAQAPLPHVVGCSRNCTPRMCVMGCPLHCCARYIKKSKVMNAHHLTHKKHK